MANTYGKWKIVRSLSEGGQAHIFLVHDENESNGRIYVLKRIKNVKRIDRLKDEISAISKLNHQNVLKLIDYEFDSASPYLVTEYCKGGTLSNSDLSNLSFLKKLYLFRDICNGVAHAHNRDIIHRDLKPENIFFRKDNITPVVGDFGICFINETGRRITLTEEAVGSRNYMAPELEDGRVESIDKTVDVYSLGKILY